MNVCKFLFFILLFSVSSSERILAQGNLSAASLVPDKSVAVVQVNWAQTRGDEKLKLLVKGDSFPEFAKQVGLSEAKVTEWIVFSDANPNSSRGLGMIVSGNFTSQSVIEFAKSKSWKTETIGTRTAYVNPADNSYLIPIRNGLLAVGTRNGMEKVQEVLTKKRSSLNTKLPFKSMWSELNAVRQPINFMIGIPQEYQKVAEIAYKVAAKLMNLASFGIMGTVMETIGFVNSMGFSVSHKNRVYPTRIFATMDSETKAWIAAGALNLLKKAPSAIGTQPKTEEEKMGLEALQSMTATYKGTLLSVKIDMPESAIPQR